MSLEKIQSSLTEKLGELGRRGTLKGEEKIITGIVAGEAGCGPRYTLAGFGDRAFLRMNSNSYLGLALHPQVVRTEAKAAEQFGTGPGAVRFIASARYLSHTASLNCSAPFWLILTP